MTEAGPTPTTRREETEHLETGHGFILLTETHHVCTWLLLARFGQVGDTRVWTHEDVAGVQVSVQEELLGVRDVDAAQRGFR